MTIGIYCIEHVSSGKRYIGKSINIESRIRSHKCTLKRSPRQKDCNRHLWSAVQKHGIDSFKFYVLQEFSSVDESAISEAELNWIDKFDTVNRKKGYNLRRDSSTKMVTHEETRKLMSEAQKGSRNGNFGNRWNDRQKSKMSEIAKARHKSGKYYNDEWRAKIGEKSSQMWADEEKKSTMAKKVSLAKLKYDFLQYDKSGNLIREWSSIKEIVDANPGYKWQNIYSVCNGYKKTYMGCVWVKRVKI